MKADKFHCFVFLFVILPKVAILLNMNFQFSILLYRYPSNYFKLYVNIFQHHRGIKSSNDQFVLIMYLAVYIVMLKKYLGNPFVFHVVCMCLQAKVLYYNDNGRSMLYLVFFPIQYLYTAYIWDIH